jgi:basic membrane protein A
MKKYLLLVLIAVLILSVFFPSCKNKEEAWKPGIPLAKENLKIGVLHITDPFSESGGYSYAHQTGIEEMKKNLSLQDSQLLYKTHVDEGDLLGVENFMRELIAQGANVILATSWGYMDTCEKMAAEFPSVIFAHATGSKHNDTNFTNYFGKVYEARYLSGIVAGLKTKTNKIGYVAAWGSDNSEITSGINAFAMGVEKVNPNAKVLVKITYNWFDPLGEAYAARTLIAEGCDVIAQHCDTPTPQEEAEKAGVWGIGYNTDMSSNAPGAVLTSVIWNWGVYYTALAQSVIDGTFTTKPYNGSLKNGMIGLAPLSEIAAPQTMQILEQERSQIEAGTLNIFSGIMETNEGRRIGREGENLSDVEIHDNINWYYRNAAVIK